VKWLLTVSRAVDDSTASDRLAKHGATVEFDPIPLDDDDKVLEVDGPADLPNRLAADDEDWVKRVSNNSEQELY
jgi:hypothetical protein